MSDHLPEPASNPLTPVTEAAAILGGSPALYVALLRGDLIEGRLVGGEWHVDTGVLAAALAVRERDGNLIAADKVGLTCADAEQGHREGAA